MRGGALAELILPSLPAAVMARTAFLPALHTTHVLALAFRDLAVCVGCMLCDWLRRGDAGRAVRCHHDTHCTHTVHTLYNGRCRPTPHIGTLQETVEGVC
jgi:hypothetical protein